MSSIPPIKPIETHYHGCRFRSRLEARWAVFFDGLLIPWQYELEGFELGNRLRYLPDFYLPQHDVFVEVKSSLITISRDEWEKITRFSQHKNILLIAGLPGTTDLFILGNGLGIDIDSFSYHFNSLDKEFDGRAFADFFCENFPDARVEFTPNYHIFPNRDNEPLFCISLQHVQGCAEYSMRQAIEQAKSARFEFGERGTSS